MIGKGTTIGYKDVGGSGTATLLAKVQDCSQPEVTIGNVDKTHYTSPNNFVEKESIVWRDVSDLGLTLVYTKAQTTTLYTLAGVEKEWTITLYDASTYVFNGFIAKLGGGSFPNKDTVKQPLTITVTGPVVFTAGA